MDDFIIVNGRKFPCNVKKTTDGVNQFVIIKVQMDYTEAKGAFVDDALLMVQYNDTDKEELTDYRMLTKIQDNLNGTMTIEYRRMTDLEKLIKHFYGRIN